MQPFPQPTNISSSTLQRELGTIMKRVSVNGEHIQVTSNGFPVLIILPVADYQALIQAGISVGKIQKK
jgi:prevent-host-death family protein